MHKFWLRLTWSVGLLLFALIAIVAIFGGDLGRRFIEYSASRYLQDKLQIEHGLNWQLWPHPTVRIRGIHLQNAQQETLARIGTLELSLYGDISLLQGQLSLRHIDIENIELYLKPERLQASAWLRKPANHETATSAPLALPNIEQLKIRNFNLHYQQTADQRWKLHFESAQMHGKSLNMHVQLHREAPQQMPFTLDGQVTSTINLPTQNTAFAIEQLQAQLQGTLNDWQLNTRLDLDQLKLSPKPTPPTHLLIATTLLREHQQIALAIQGRRQTEQKTQLKLVASARDNKTAQFIARADGTIEALAAQTALKLEHAHLVAINPATQRPHHLALKNTSIKLDSIAKQAHIHLKGALDNEALQADIALQMQKAPFVQIKAQLKRLDLDRYLVNEKQKTKENAPQNAVDFWRHWPILLDLSVKTLHFNDIISHNSRLRLYNEK